MIQMENLLLNALNKIDISRRENQLYHLYLIGLLPSTNITMLKREISLSR